MLLLIIILISCSKKETYTIETVNGVKTYRNTNIPADTNFKINPKEIFTINGTDENNKDSTRNFSFPNAVNIDSQNNIYILDRNYATIIKFDDRGNFIKSFGGKGNGPGEMLQPIGLSIVADTLYVVDGKLLKIVKFDFNGRFITDFSYSNNGTPQFLFKLNNSSFISLTTYSTIENDKEYETFSLQILDSKFNITKVLKSVKAEYIGINFNGHDYTFPFTVGKENIFVANVSADKYLIDVYSFKGDLLYTINKYYAKIPMSEEEVNSYTRVRFKSYPDQSKLPKFDLKYKKCVNMWGMFCDKDGNLLVQSAQNRNNSNKEDFIVDVFKDGVYLNTIKLDIGKGFDFYNADHRRYFFNNKIYYINREDNYVKIFEY